MKALVLISTLLGSLLMAQAEAQTEAVSQLLNTYTKEAGVSADGSRGKQLWQKTYKGKGEFGQRSCTTCHTKDLSKNGRHVKTNKTIKPMSPDVNPQRLTKVRKIKKWFKRNCKWTMGRECTAREKADILVYITNQARF